MKKIPFLLIFMSVYLVIGLSIILIVVNIPNQQVNFPLTLKDITTKVQEKIQPKYPKPLSTPEKVKGIYLTGYTFSNSKRRNELIDLVESTELNALVIDIKDPGNKLAFTPESEKLKQTPISKVAMPNEDYIEILADLQDRGIYTIARITTFQDNTAVKAFPELALKNKSGGIWYNWGGISWLDMTNPGAWEISVLQAKEAALLGYDEIQFDYIRFPSDGDISYIQYYDFPAGKKKYEILTDFFQYAFQELEEINIPLSIDLFGLTYQNRPEKEYDLNIGQRLVDAAPYFDFISPMVYPSHYPIGYLGLANPAAYPYAVVNEAMSQGNLILANTTSSKALTRPWLQDFDLGANYDASMVKAQIQACDDNNVAGWLLWNPHNRYTVGALEKE